MFRNKFNIRDISFKEEFYRFLSLRNKVSNEVTEIVQSIIIDIETKGDEALVKYTNELDKRKIETIRDCFVESNRLDESLKKINEDERNALELAAKRIKNFHVNTCLDFTSGDLIPEASRVFRPLDRVGVYVPGGKANYPSTVLMAAIPAKVAGVEEVIMTLPAINGQLSDLTLAAARISKVDKVYTFGGAQAIAAMALGTESVSRVDKIVGPGNKYVTEAKRQLYGRVGIDGIQGPSEIVIIADTFSNIGTIVWDLISQAEHDEMATSILISDDQRIIDKVEKEMSLLVKSQDRRNIILKSLESNSALFKVDSIDQAIEISNEIAPEHLNLCVKEPRYFLKRVKNAGLILLGEKSSIALSDYVLGPSHVLPTGGSSRFASSLCVEDFMKFSNIIDCEKIYNTDDYESLLNATELLAKKEGLVAHAISAKIRKNK
jgi:histidinol dehydrogenase